MALDTDKIMEELKGATILELNDLVKAIEDEFDVTAAAPVAAAGAAAALGGRPGERLDMAVPALPDPRSAGPRGDSRRGWAHHQRQRLLPLPGR